VKRLDQTKNSNGALKAREDLVGAPSVRESLTNVDPEASPLATLYARL